MLFRVLAITILLIAAALAWNYYSQSENDQQTKPAKQAAETQMKKPSFDTVRIDKNGAAVLAGRAEPFSLVSLFNGKKLLSSTHVSARGEWVMVLEHPLALTKPSYLRLRAKNRDGTILLSDQIITIGALRIASDKPMIALTQSKTSSRILQSNRLSSATGAIVLEVIDYDDASAAIFSGRAQAGWTIKLYRNNKFIGATRAAKNDKWKIAIKGLEEGLAQLRLDLADDSGKIVARLELPFKMEKMSQSPQNDGRKNTKVRIQPGDNLWSIARNLYGAGWEYTIIYEHNQDRIKNPNLIYPGQVFEAPNR